VEPTTVEINPYLSDVIEAKLQTYDSTLLARDLGLILTKSRRLNVISGRHDHLPPTFVEPGKSGRWIFSLEVANELQRLTRAIESLSSENHQRFFRVQLGGLLVSVSNIRISGKGRRYRSGWKKRELSKYDVRSVFIEACQKAIVESHTYASRAMKRYKLIRGDARTSLPNAKQVDLVVFSPPYPNSFDYTDVYNVELWMLGHLSTTEDNRVLRIGTLTSHVQIKRDFAAAPTASKRLTKTLKKLSAKKSDLWSPHIPAMLGAYFNELESLLSTLKVILARRGSVWMVVGDSQYAGVRINVAKILIDLATNTGFHVRSTEPFRSMRSSPQQGGRAELPETLLIFDNV
jgi:hypothetical protein